MAGVACARAPGKLVVLGEYAVLEGAPALVTAVDRYAVVRARPAPRSEVEAHELGVRAAFEVERGRVVWGQQVTADQRAALSLVAACIEEAAPGSTPLALEVDTRELVDAKSGAKLGLGSSAAVSVALCGALLARAGITDAQEIFARALAAHRGAQSGGSGVDVAAACFGQSLVFRAGAAPRFYPVALTVEMVCVWTGRAASTRALVQAVHDFAERDRAGYSEHMAALARVAARGVAAARACDVEALRTAIAAYGTLLADLGKASGAAIWSAEHRRWQSIVEAAGGVYKPSGAGGGDCGIAVARSQAEAQSLTLALLSAHARVVPLKSAARGFHIENEP
ncbi:MAG: hypothetical protein HYZ27_00170 [Deltaproteobacteria bacterium]|nr:hypothetical protein [Deltaproteobacteria bacterium]